MSETDDPDVRVVNLGFWETTVSSPSDILRCPVSYHLEVRKARRRIPRIRKVLMTDLL
jgi:hypothetical protein